MKRVAIVSTCFLLAGFAAYAAGGHSAASVITQGGKGMGQSAFNNVFGDISGQVHTNARTTVVINPRHGGGHYHCAPFCTWVPGHYEVVYQQVWIPPHYVERWVPPVYDYRLVRGTVVRVVVQPGYYERVLVPGYYEVQPCSIWVPGRWLCGY